ncbi:MAG: GNAT family N-acetyltransferase [Dehalococcoidia bacterium]|nr:GNAT family N-acetyltransferase [Dehalococcoidia bacterium]
MHREIGQYVIRDWNIEDAPSIAKYANNRKIWINLRDAFPHPYGLQDAESFITSTLAAEPVTVYAIASQSEAIGAIGLILGQDVNRFTAEIGYWLAEPFWGKGITTESVKSLTAHAIRELKLHRVFAEPFTTNPASARVLEKAGYRCEGIQRSSAFKNGEVLDQFLYSYVARRSTDPGI